MNNKIMVFSCYSLMIQPSLYSHTLGLSTTNSKELRCTEMDRNFDYSCGLLAAAMYIGLLSIFAS